MSEKKSWRDVYRVHPAADVFPMLPEDELRKLGEDIKQNGLKEDIVLWKPGGLMDRDPYHLLDGRNRLDAMELVGMLKVHDKSLGSLRNDGTGEKHLYGNNGVDPYTYVISKNIRRRHLTKEQQADLIVKVMKASTDLAKLAKSVKENDLAKTARSFSPESGKRGGSTKDPFKKKVVEEAKKHGISKRTAEKAIAKERGPTKKPRRKNKPGGKPGEFAGFMGDIPAYYNDDGIATVRLGVSTCSTTGEAVLTAAGPAIKEPEIAATKEPKPSNGTGTGKIDQNAEDVIRKVIAFIDKNLSDKETLSMVADRISQALGERIPKARPLDKDPVFKGSNYYEIKFSVFGSRVAQVKKRLTELFPYDEIEVVSPHGGGRRSRGARLEEARSIVEELQQEIQDWRDNLPENLQGGTKAEKLDECIESLETLVGDFDVEFPSAFGD